MTDDGLPHNIRLGAEVRKGRRPGSRGQVSPLALVLAAVF
jgi:hypothetical protein